MIDDDLGASPCHASRPFTGPILNGSKGSILLKNSEIELPRKSRFRAQSVACTGSCHSKAYERVAGGKTSRSAEPLRNFPSRLPAVF